MRDLKNMNYEQLHTEWLYAMGGDQIALWAFCRAKRDLVKLLSELKEFGIFGRDVDALTHDELQEMLKACRAVELVNSMSVDELEVMLNI